MLLKSFYEKEEEEEEKEDDEIQPFRRSVSQLLHTQRYIHKYFCELLGISFSLHAWFGVCSFFGHYLGDTYLW